MKLDRRAYAEMFGPTVGDRVRLGDTSVTSNFKVGLESVRKFQQLCKRSAT